MIKHAREQILLLNIHRFELEPWRLEHSGTNVPNDSSIGSDTVSAWTIHKAEFCLSWPDLRQIDGRKQRRRWPSDDWLCAGHRGGTGHRVSSRRAGETCQPTPQAPLQWMPMKTKHRAEMPGISAVFLVSSAELRVPVHILVEIWTRRSWRHHNTILLKAPICFHYFESADFLTLFVYTLFCSSVIIIISFHHVLTLKCVNNLFLHPLLFW